MSVSERKILTNFIELYKSLPCLWDVEDVQYTKKEARHHAYKLLLRKLKEIDENADIDNVRKKIEHMRTVQRRERRKVLAAKAMGKQYIPKLWYYNHLKFIHKHEGYISEDDEYAGAETLEIVDSDPLDSTDMDMQENKNDDMLIEYLIDSPSPAKGCVVRESSDNEASGETEAFGHTIGLQLQKLCEQQRFVAEKLISDVIYYGRMKKLNPESSIQLN